MNYKMKHILFLLLSFILAFSSLGASSNTYYNEKLAELQQQADADHMRFIELPDGGYNAEIAADILANDHRILEEAPIGSIKVTVLDADTNRPISDAMVLLTASLSYYTTVDGVSTQTGNAFLVTNLGQSGTDGVSLYKQPLFYHDDDVLNEDGSMKTDYLDYWSIGIASVDTANAKIQLQAPDPYSYQTEEVKLALAALDPNGIWAYADFIAAVAAVPGITKADLVVDDLLDECLAVYTDDTIVKLYKEADLRIDTFSGVGDADRKISMGELKSFIESNHPLLTEKIVNRYYRSITGYTPTFKISGSAEVTETTIYKDGTSDVSTDSATIYLDLFEDQTGGQGLAYSSSGFSYRAYAYHPDYASGKTKGATVRQYLNTADQELVILLSKDTPPFSIDSQKTVVYGRLMAASGKPLAGARITGGKGQLIAVSDSDGYFTMAINNPGEYVLKITPPETANSANGNVSINGGDFKDEILISVNETPARYHIDWYEKGFDLSKARVSTSAEGKDMTPLLIGLAGLLVLIVLIIILAGRKKRRQIRAAHMTSGSTGAYYPQPLTPPIQPAYQTITCSQCGTYISAQEQFCHSCGAKICSNCHASYNPGVSFCRKCGKQL